ncbi:MAG: hypothetical protein WCA47_03995, partial [Terriglobales bacterium]
VEAVTLEESPAEVKEKLLARGEIDRRCVTNQAFVFGLCGGPEQSVGDGDSRIEAGGQKQTRTKQIATIELGH